MNWEDITVYSITDAGLKELVGDSDAWELVGVDNLPSIIEKWVVTARVTGDTAGEQTADEYGDDEEVDDEVDDSESDVDEEFEEIDDEVDDFLFYSNVDNTLEFGGVGNQESDVLQENKRGVEELPFFGSDEDTLSKGDGNDKVRLPVFKAKRDLKNSHFSVGLLFPRKFGGTMLVANGVDTNENIFPFAYAIVEAENKESWTWFLDLLTFDLELNDSKEPTFTFMSEGNFKNARYSGEALKDLLWEAAKATTVSLYEEVMRKINDEDVEACDWLVGKQASEWSRSHFHIAPKSDILTNNICESYNRVLKEARSQTLIRCLESIREMLMKRFFDLREKAENWKGLLCPTVASKVAINSKLVGGYTAIQSDISVFEVKGYRAKNWEQHGVDLVERSCTCNVWQLTGIPCAHAICAIWIQRQQHRKEVEEYVDEYYFVQTYKEVYKGCIKPLRGRSEWPDDERQPLNPPLLAPKPGRPKKKRKKGVGELTKDGKKLSCVFTNRRCGKCKKSAAKQKKSHRKLLKRRMLRAARKSGQEEAASNSVNQTEISCQETTEPWWADLPVEPDICSENLSFIPTPTTQDNEKQDGNNGIYVFHSNTNYCK
ncbi:unnamed protein product [Cuscuta campestris]|uniref:SWIM-type domain-containing protein n=1 Tax=Cuscuta campestris TaxID=132261 RepID=A0A484MMU9_9ASTE|nr:unnamed protein product [Cuscuta campestris]